MSVARRLWQITQALVLLASLAIFLLIASGYALLVFFAHDARVSLKVEPRPHSVIAQC